MRKVIILQGLPGSGKSTYVERLRANATVLVNVCSADDFFIAGDGSYQFDAAKLPEAHSACMLSFLERASLRPDEAILIVDNTNTTMWEMAPYRAVALAYGWEVELHTFPVDVETAAARNIHGVPREAIERMAARMETPPAWWIKQVVHQ